MVSFGAGRSREGARIEIRVGNTQPLSNIGRSREGARIEIFIAWRDKVWRMCCVAPARERGLKFLSLRQQLQPLPVAPARERGLKYLVTLNADVTPTSLPRGSED